MPDPIIIQLIADYGTGDPAFAEVVQKLTYLDRHIRVHATSVPAFSTLATGIWISQFATVNAFPGLIIYANTAPRKVLKESTHESTDGGRLVYAQLDDGATIVAVNAGYSLSFIKHRIKKLNLISVANAGSQFRSRDFYPDVVVAIAHGDMRFIGEDMDISAIPEAPKNKIGFADGYGNLKTSCRHSESSFAVGSKVKITVNGISKEGVVSDETYKVQDGDVSFAPGSTGGDDRFMEIWVRGESAWEAFGKPKVETEFKVEAV